MMTFYGRKKYWYVPDLENNLSLAEDEQLAIEILRPTAENQGDLTSVAVAKDEQGTVNMTSTFNTKKILRNHVGQIRNLRIAEKTDQGEMLTREIATGRALAESSFYGAKTLVSLICAEVLSDTVTEEQKKI